MGKEPGTGDRASIARRIVRCTGAAPGRMRTKRRREITTRSDDPKGGALGLPPLPRLLKRSPRLCRRLFLLKIKRPLFQGFRHVDQLPVKRRAGLYGGDLPQAGRGHVDRRLVQKDHAIVAIIACELLQERETRFISRRESQVATR